MVRCPARPDCLWIQHHNGIFRSRDNGSTWEEIEGVQPSSFGFAVAVHPRDPDTAWFVPVGGQVVVTRTRDGGRSFEVLRKGLPQEHAYDLCFRHALDIDTTGEVLAFGSTTGSLWVSEDGGDSWQTVSEHRRRCTACGSTEQPEPRGEIWGAAALAAAIPVSALASPA
jgi:photosystem II stability/assembly factor-like uncharacterized protein